MRRINKPKKYFLMILLSPWYLLYILLGSVIFLTFERSKRVAKKIDTFIENHENAKS